MDVIFTLNCGLNILGIGMALICGVLVAAGIPTKMPRRFSSCLLSMLGCLLLTLSAYLVGELIAGGPGSAAITVHRAADFFNYDSNFLLVNLYVVYYCLRAEVRGRRREFLLNLTCMLDLLMMCLLWVSQFDGLLYYCGADNIYYRGPLFWTTRVYTVIVFLSCAIDLVIHCKRYTRRVLVNYFTDFVIILVLMPLQLLIRRISIDNLIMIVLCFRFFLEQMSRAVQELVRREAALVQAQEQQKQLQTSIMLSQIQPHFLYNALNAIYYLCDEDPKAAQRTVKDFSDYLRVNLDSLSNSAPVSFDTELRHLKTYLNIEQLRFGERLNIVWDIRCTDFRVPALSVQPLAENAVKHGLCCRPEGGTLRISTEEKPDCFEVCISDDGVGFAVDSTPDDGRNHYGIENVRSRVESMCGGRLLLVSTVGVGTRAILKLPKEMKL